jgi:phage protein D
MPRQRVSVAVYAGYDGTGVTLRFLGDITRAVPTQPPDIWLSMKAMTGYHNKAQLLARTAPERTKLSALAGNVAADLGLTLDYQATDKDIANYSFTGGALGQVNKLADSGMVDAYVDDDRLVVKDRGKPLAGRVRKLSEATGMIGIPEVDEKGVKVRMLLDPYTTLGSRLDISSVQNPAANGQFTVYKMSERGALRDTAFYIDAEALRPGLGGLLL